MKGRHSEVDDLNDFVAAEAKRLGMQAPVNEAIVELTHRVEMGVLNATPEISGSLQIWPARDRGDAKSTAEWELSRG
jgi:hypothetical protein